MTKRLVIFLVRHRLGLKLYQKFRFSNQKSYDIYYFTETALMKVTETNDRCVSSVGLNFLLSDQCNIVTTFGMIRKWY
jgi:hypothetical protein